MIRDQIGEFIIRYFLCISKLLNITEWIFTKIFKISLLRMNIPFTAENTLSPRILKSETDTANTGKQINKSEFRVLWGGVRNIIKNKL